MKEEAGKPEQKKGEGQGQKEQERKDRNTVEAGFRSECRRER